MGLTFNSVELRLLEPIIPHVCAELSEELFDSKNLKGGIAVLDEVFVQDTLTLGVAINAKRRCFSYRKRICG